jgi:chromate transporter
MFILLGGPFVERSRGEIRLGAILAAISAAVVGVIANMAWEFGAVTFKTPAALTPLRSSAWS